eukprot:CAMPEP_0205819484 /NCGR_PEP_ID=MMETSP0206-20130828/1875_1 /ASSEMBLY_ACC=CAM_ASM_000279 /TAXON_ID=36767 /ORGANISM="Euplotes focardii, Strain TN1" /LENGTH=49 /DNA_ID=CAMNT_0053113133 /DNA_START=30 /DNA_END=180 /DNA_ORIENTATION=-
MAVYVDWTSEDIGQEGFSYGAAFALNIVDGLVASWLVASASSRMPLRKD